MIALVAYALAGAVMGALIAVAASRWLLPADPPDPAELDDVDDGPRPGGWRPTEGAAR